MTDHADTIRRALSKYVPTDDYYGPDGTSAALAALVAERDQARAERDTLYAAIKHIKFNAESWHGVESEDTEDTGAQKALNVIAEWCDEAPASVSLPQHTTDSRCCSENCGEERCQKGCQQKQEATETVARAEEGQL